MIMAQREILLEQMLKVLKDIETNTCDKEFFPATDILEKKLDRIIKLHEEEVRLLALLGEDRCTCGKHREKKEKKDKKSKKEKKNK
jgi:hypothetical protein